MKVNISVGSSEFKNGYLNIDPVSKPDGLDIDIRKLDTIIEDAECTEFIAEDVLDYLEKLEAENVLEHWISKIRKGGKIIIGGIDAYEVSKMFYQQKITLEEFNTLIHGAFSQPWDVRLNNFTMEYIQSKLINAGLKITKKRLDGYHIIVEGKRL
ncbi:hypothetical protein CL634_08840 [bacterium]|nr:hypothetical protein [bacterium]|tara:strand:+ start:250 stop:714 length:465 start_codon:yes stop_codon:yes gene_type:complete